MKNSLRVGRIGGVTISIHYTWLIVFGLMIYSLASGVFPRFYPHWSPAENWSVSALATILLFVSVLAHELGHSFVARAKGIPVQDITLFMFGGATNISQETDDPGDELQIAMAGPSVSVMAAIITFAIGYLTAPVNELVCAIFLYLAGANIILVIFNLVPGYPLDGGRMLRSILWGFTGDAEMATRVAATLGGGLGYLCIIGGIIYAFWDLMGGIWLVAIGWFLQNAAEHAYHGRPAATPTPSGVKVRSLMDLEPVTVRPDVMIDDLVHHYILERNVRGVPVVDGGNLVGIITLTDIKDLPHDEWSRLRVLDRMTAFGHVIMVTPDTDLGTALEKMSAYDIHQLPVVDGNAVVGLLTRGAVIRFFQSSQELAVPIGATVRSSDEAEKRAKQFA
jgi:Zn-dependent protease/predicted transcriptional regulator